MQKIKITSLALTMFLLFQVLFFSAVVHAQIKVNDQGVITNKGCEQAVKELQMRIKSLNKVHMGMHNAISSSLPLDRMDRYNRHINILEGNLDREINLMDRLLKKVQKKGGKCKEIEDGLLPHIDKMHEIRANVHAAIFNSNISKYKILVDKLGHRVKSMSGDFK
jgi:hypothetical protein